MHDMQRLLGHAADMLDRGHADQAIDVLTRLLGEDPENSTAHALLAMALLEVKRPHAAGLEAEIALAMDPESTLPLLALVSVQVARQQFRLAERGLREILRRDPEEPTAHSQFASLYLAWGRLALALASADAAVRLAPERASSHALRATIAHATGDRTEARASALQSLEIDPEQVQAIVVLGFCDLAEGRIANAREHVAWALQNDPSDEAALRLLCAIKARTNALLGAWWRLQTFLAAGSQRRMIVLLMSFFLAYQIMFIAFDEGGHERWLPWLSAAWLGLCAYTWIAPVAFWKMVRRELRSVTLRPGY